MRTLVIAAVLVGAIPARAAPPAVVAVELEATQVDDSFNWTALPVSDLEPGGLLVPKGVDAGWLTLGLKVGDVIQSENGAPIGDSLSVSANSRTIFGIVRNGKPVLLQLTVFSEPREAFDVDDDDIRKMTVATPPFAVAVRDARGPSGVRLTDTLLALYAKLSVGDVVRTIGGSSIRSEAALVKALTGLPQGASDVVLERFGRTVVVTLTREPPIDLTKIKRVTSTTFTLPRAVADAIARDTWLVTYKAKLVPAGSKGKLHGMKLYDVEPDSLYAAIGLQSEDVILDVDGNSIDTRQDAYAMKRKLAKASTITVNIARRGVRLAMVYTIQ
ncbi:MAG: hypothetical protein ABI867_40805 [Kofleriaceae bacterium]